MATTVETILDTLKSDLKDYVKVSRGYNTTPTTILKGSFGPDEVSKSFPVIGFDITSEEFESQMGDTGFAYVYLDIYGYTYTDGVDRIDAIRKLAHDVLYFIYNDFTYTDEVSLLEPMEYGGFKTLMFRLPIRIRYEWTTTNIR